MVTIRWFPELKELRKKFTPHLTLLGQRRELPGFRTNAEPA
jgi:hypothetical protein